MTSCDDVVRGAELVERRVRSLWSFLRVPGEQEPVVLFWWPDGLRWMFRSPWHVTHWDWPNAAVVEPHQPGGVVPPYVLVKIVF